MHKLKQKNENEMTTYLNPAVNTLVAKAMEAATGEGFIIVFKTYIANWTFLGFVGKN